jgi:hypothetical protein
MKEKTIIILRWIGVIPGAFGSFVLSYALSMLTYKLSMYAFVSTTGDGGWFNKYGIEVISCGIGGYCFVYFAAKIAPRFLKDTSFWLMVLELVISGGLLFFHLFRSNWYMSIEVVAVVIGAVLAYKATEEEASEEI